MKNDIQANGYLSDAQIIIQETQNSKKEGHFHRVVRKAQESAELSVKALFKYLGIEYPKAHILGRIIKKELTKKELRKEDLERLSYFYDSLAFEREVAFYGSPDGRPADSLYDKSDAEEALEKARWILNYVKGIIKK